MTDLYKEEFSVNEIGLIAWAPAGSTLDWGFNEAKEMTRTSDTINTATVLWNLATGLTQGVIVNSSTSSATFITVPAVPRDEPYRCTLTYQTNGGRTRVKAFWLYVVDPTLFFQ